LVRATCAPPVRRRLKGKSLRLASRDVDTSSRGASSLREQCLAVRAPCEEELLCISVFFLKHAPNLSIRMPKGARTASGTLAHWPPVKVNVGVFKPSSNSLARP
jgi:hypothetical protein